MTNKTFDLEHQYQLYLKRVGLKESNMDSVQRKEMRQFFMGACRQMLILLRDDLGEMEESEAIETMQDIINHVHNYFMKSTNKMN